MIHLLLRDTSRLQHPRWWVLIFLGGCLAYATASLLPFGLWSFFLVAGAWLIAAYVFRWGAPPQARPPKGAIPWSLIPLLLWWLYVYLAASFGNVDIGAIYFHLQAGMTDHGGASRVVAAIVSTLCAVLIVVAFSWLVRHDHRWRLIERILALLLLATNPLLFGITQRSAAIIADDGAWLDRRYVAPVIHSAPQTPPNLLLIYLESLEHTYADHERFGNAYADLEAIAANAVHFLGVRQLDNTGWTMAGMIASQCGTPLMPAGLLHDRQFEPLEEVVPGVTCLGDLLHEQGYRQSYLGGASTNFAGKGLFYYGHSYDAVHGREELTPRMEDPEYLNSWGLYDDTLFDFVREEVRELSTSDQPWNLTVLTISGHAPNGHPAQRCLDRQGEFDGVDILYSVECNAWLTRELLDDLSQEGLLDNTLVVLTSDHLSMRVSAWEELIAGPRENTFMLLGSGLEPQRIERESSMLDVFPTILEAMGFEIHQHRAGLGASLLSPVQTLLERHDETLINSKLHEERELQLRLWDGLAPAARKEEDDNATEEEKNLLPPVL